MLCYRGGDKQNILQTDLCAPRHSQTVRFWFQRLSSVSNLISIKIKGLRHCNVAAVVVLVVLQEETKWQSHPQEACDGVLGLWVSDHPYNTEVRDWVSMRLVGSQTWFSLHWVLGTRPIQMWISLRKMRPNRATCHMLSHCNTMTFFLLSDLKGSCCCLRKPLSSQEVLQLCLNEQAQQLMGWHNTLPELSITGWHRLETCQTFFSCIREVLTCVPVFLHGERPLFRAKRSGKGRLPVGWGYAVWVPVQAAEHLLLADIWRGFQDRSSCSLSMGLLCFLEVSLDLRGFLLKTNHHRVHSPLFSATLSKLCFFVCRPLPRPPPPWPPPSLPQQRPTHGLNTVSGRASVPSPHLGAR